MKVNVLILPEGRAVSGEVFADIPFAAIREDIVEAFGLGDAKGWSFAIVPSDLGQSPDAYTMSPGDTIWLMRTDHARKRGFVPASDPS
jgi:hypothetical protein